MEFPRCPRNSNHVVEPIIRYGIGARQEGDLAPEPTTAGQYFVCRDNGCRRRLFDRAGAYIDATGDDRACDQGISLLADSVLRYIDAHGPDECEQLVQ